MGKHHHHPHEGHSDGTHHTPSARKPIHHSPWFYVAGLCIFVALLIYLLSGDLVFTPRVQAPSTSTSR